MLDPRNKPDPAHRWANIPGVTYPQRWENVPGVQYPQAVPQTPRERRAAPIVVRVPDGYVSTRKACEILRCPKANLSRHVQEVRAVCKNGKLYYLLGDLLRCPYFAVSRLPASPPPGYVTVHEAMQRTGMRHAKICAAGHDGRVRTVRGRGEKGTMCYFYHLADVMQMVKK